jgi:hypothetical protein
MFVDLNKSASTHCFVRSGNFTIEQGTPDIVISFTYQCGNDATTALQGKLKFKPRSALTATPTIAPDKVFKIKDGKGRFHAEIEASPTDWMAGRYGTFTMDGFATVKNDTNYITFIGADSTTTYNEWYFSFGASPLQFNHLYENVRQWRPNNGFPSMDIVPRGSSCGGSSLGTFIIEKQAPVVISFTFQCGQKATNNIRGRLTFTPAELLPPTPTSAPNKLFSLTNSNGRASVTFNSPPGERMGEGVGEFSIEAQAALSYEKGVLGLNVTGPSPWSFKFYSPSLVIGQPYKNATAGFYPNNNMLPAFEVQGRLRCINSIGEFTILQQTPTLVITFKFYCDAKDAKALQGKITYTPNKK